MYTSLPIHIPARLTGIYSFFRHQYDGDYRFCGEMHDFWEVVYVQKGKLGVTAGEQVYDLSEGELIVHSPMEFHNLFVIDSMGADVVIVSFTAQMAQTDLFSQKVFSLNAFQRELICRVFSYLDERKFQNAHYLQWYDAVDKHADECWFMPYMHLFEDDAQALSMAASCVEQLLTSLSGCEGRTRESLSGETGLFHRAMDYLSTYVDRNVPVDELAKALSISRSSLNRLFQKYAGVSVHRYCLMQKIKNATECLQSGLSVTETAEHLGFSNQSYFSACYKRETGINPSEVSKK